MLPAMFSIKHRSHSLSFVDKNVPISDGGLRLLLKSSAARRVNLLSLVEFLMDELNSTEYVATNPTNFALVNIFSTFTNFSYGICEPPPDIRCFGSSAHLHFTFAISDTRHYKPTSKIANVSRRNLAKSVWALSLGRPQFVTISLPAIDIHSKYGISQMYGRELEFLYVLVGSLLKTQISSNYTEQRTEDLPRLATKYLKLGIHNAIEHYPISCLKYVSEVWEYLPSLIKMDDMLAVYYFAFIHNLPTPTTPKDTVLKLRKELIAVLQGGILAFVQSADQDLDVSSTKCLLAAAILSQMIYSADNYIDIDANTSADWQTELQRIRYSLITRFRDNEIEVSRILMPANVVAERFFTGNTQFANRLLTILG